MRGHMLSDRITGHRRAATSSERRPNYWPPNYWPLNGWLRSGRLMGCFLTSALLASCGDLTSGGFGEVEVLITADSVLAASGLAPDLAALLESGEDGITGTLTVQLQVDLRRGPDTWIGLTDGVQEVTLVLGSPDPVLLARREVPPGRYRASRTRFRLVRAQVEGGLTVGGAPYVGSVLVPLPTEGGALVLPLAFDVIQGGVRELVLEMRADRWLPRVDPDQRTVARGDFEAVQELRPR